MYAWSVYKHAVVAAFSIYAQVVKMLPKEDVYGSALNSHGNYIADHGKSWKNHGIVFLNFCGNSVYSSTLFQPVTTFVICSSHPFMFLDSIYYKQYGPSSGCSFRSSLIRAHSV